MRDSATCSVGKAEPVKPASKSETTNPGSIWDFYRTEKELQKSRRRAKEWTVPTLRRFWPSEKNVRVLIVGCGSGVDVAVVREHGYPCFGTDLDPNCYDGSRSVFVQADACRLPFGTGAFDALISLEVIEHIGALPGVWKPLRDSKVRREQFTAELARVVQPRGMIVLATPNRFFPFDEHGEGKTHLRWHLPFHDLTLSYFELKRLFLPYSSEVGTLPYGRYFALEKIERLLGMRGTRMLSILFPMLSSRLIHLSPLNPHLFLYFRRNSRAVD